METFFTSVGCMDGRVQHVIEEYGKKKFSAEYPDTITEAGLVGQLAKGSLDPAFLDSLKLKVATVSLGKHQSKGIVVHGHGECAGNPVSDVQQKKDIEKAVEVIKSFGVSVPVVGVFVARGEKGWEVKEEL